MSDFCLFSASSVRRFLVYLTLVLRARMYFVSRGVVVRCLLSSMWKQLKSQHGGARVGYFDTFSMCMDPVFFLTSIFAEEYSRAAAPLWSVLLNEPLLPVAISPVRSAACTSTSLRVLAAVDRSTELKCCGPFVPRRK